MNQTGKIFQFEVYKTVKNKFLMVAFFVFFAAFMAVILFSALRFPLKDTSAQEPGFDREQTFAFYEKERAQYKLFLDYLNGGDVLLPPGVILAFTKEECQKQYDLYDYLIRTQTLQSDYLSTAEQGFDEKHRGSYIMTEMLQVLAFILPVLAILTAFYVFTFDYGGGTAKNLFAAPIKRKQTFYGKMLFLCVLNLFIVLLSLLVPVAFGVSDLSAEFLLYGAKGYAAQTAFSYLFFPKATAVLFSTVFYAALSALLGQLLKKRTWGLLTPLFMFGGLQLLYVAFDWFLGVEIFAMPFAFLRYKPLCDILEVFTLFSTAWPFLITSSVVVIAFTAISAICGAKKLERQDF